MATDPTRGGTAFIVHAAHPWAEGAFLIECTEPLMRTDERLLGHVFGFSALVQNTIADIEHACLIARHEFAKRLGLAATGTLDQVAVGGRTHG